MNETSRPQLAQPRELTRPANARNRLLEEVISNTRQGFDIDAFHVMERRDNTLIADEVLNGAGSNKFVYAFKVSGKEVSGVSVIGARHLAATYGGLKHRIVASITKVGALHVFKSYPAEGSPMRVAVERILDLDDEPDYYEVLVEITDIKSGNSLQVEKRETAKERRQDGSTYDRPHYQLIAQSKAFRNGILDIIPQDVVLKWKMQQLALGKDDVITDGVRDEKLAAILKFASAKGVVVDRLQVEALTMDQIGGLREAAQNGLPAFTNAAVALGLINSNDDGADNATGSAAKTKATGKSGAAPKKGTQTQDGGMPESDPNDPGPEDARGGKPKAALPPHDPETGEIDDGHTDRARPTEQPSNTAKKGLF